MSKDTTTVVGYFNSNDYSMQLVISEHNLTLHLKPKQWVADRDGHIVNDPILDNYVGKGRLSRASDQTKQSPIVRLTTLNHVTPAGQAPTQYQHPVYQATGFVKDANGQMVAVRPQDTAPQPTVPPPASYNPVKAMSVEQARKLRLIRPTKNVPEDFGVTDNAGIPVSGAPEIKYAHDTTTEVPVPAVVAQPLTPEQAALVNNMQEAQKLNPESPTFVEEAAKQALQRQAQPALTPPPAAVLPPPPPSSAALLSKLTKSVPPPIPPPIPAQPEPTVMTMNELPDPVLTPEAPPAPAPQPTLVVEEELGQPAAPAKATVVVPQEGTPKAVVKCPLCPNTKPFSTTGYLIRHINGKHGDRAPALLAQLGLA
jgi:hypothetical protein